MKLLVGALPRSGRPIVRGLCRATATLIVLVLVVLPAYAQAPAQISIQGYLEDGGNPVVTPQNLELSLYTAVSGGTQVFMESHTGVTVTDGVYTILLGSINDLSAVDFNQELWVQTKVATTTLSPRTKLGSSPSAMTLVAPTSVRGAVADTSVLIITNSALSGKSNAMFGETKSSSAGAAGIVGKASSTSGIVIGVNGVTESEEGMGVHGRANSQSGQNFGVRGETVSTDGIGVLGWAQNPSGPNIGVYGQSASPDGWGGYFTGGKGLHVDGSKSEIVANSDGVTSYHLFLNEQESGDYARLRMRNDSNTDFWDIAAGGANNNDLNFYKYGAGDIMALHGTGDLLVMSNGARLAGGTWTNASSRRLKTDFKQVDAESVLDSLRQMPVWEWSYATEPGIRHIGPTAEDFREAFGLGSDNGGIGTVDTDGVALVAIQALRDIVGQQGAILAIQQQEIARLRDLVDRLANSEASSERIRR